MVIWLFIFGLFNQLKLGAYSIVAITTLIIVYSIIKQIKSRKIGFSISFPVLGFILVSFWDLNHVNNLRFGEWDEFNRWAVVPKGMFYFNQLVTNVPHGDNLPGLAIFPYFISSIRGTWVESDVFWAYHLIIIAIIFSIFSDSRISLQKLIPNLFSFILLLTSLVVFFNPFETVYADPIMSIIFGYTLFLASKSNSRWQDHYCFNVAIAVLILSKEIAPYLAIVSIVVYVANFVYRSKTKKLSFTENRSSVLVYSLVPLFVMVFSVLAWTFFSSSKIFLNSTSKALSGVKIESENQSLFDALIYSNKFSQRVIETFQDKLLQDRVTPFGIPFSTAEWGILLIVLLFVLSRIYVNDTEKKISGINSVILVVGGFGYIFILLAVYLVVYSGSNSRSLTSFDRYISSYLAGTLFYIFLVFASRFSLFFEKKYFVGIRAKNFSKLAMILVSILIFQSVPGYLIGYINKPGKVAENFRPNFEVLVSKIQLSNFDSNDKFIIIAQHTKGYEFYVLRYELVPANLTFEGKHPFPYSIGSPYGPEDIWTDRNMTPERFEKALMRTDYVLIYSLSESFIDEFGSYFQDLNSLTEQGIYRVERTGEKITLVKHI